MSASDSDSAINAAKNKIKEDEEEISRKYKEIEEKKKNLNIKYFKLREILEDESNHEEDLICKPLKREKKIEYENILNDYKKDYINAEFEKKKKEISDKYAAIKQHKENLFKLELTKESNEIIEFEEKRRKIMENVIGILRDSDQYKEIINRVDKLLKTDTNK
jgi:hypothetical protein